MQRIKMSEKVMRCSIKQKHAVDSNTTGLADMDENEQEQWKSQYNEKTLNQFLYYTAFL